MTSKPVLDTKKLIKSFDSGDILHDGGLSPTEKVTSRPGVTKKMVQVYEGKGQETSSATPIGGTKRQTSVTIPEWIEDKLGQPAPKLKILIVFCHYEKKSFNGQLLAATVAALEKEEHDVTVSDLYEMKFNCAPSQADMTGELDNKDDFDYVYEGGVAYEKGTLADDIKAEQKKIQEADMVIFQFPLHWGGLPAKLKGWVDRVFTKKFAFDDMKAFDTGLMQGKKALLSFTLGGTEAAYSNRGIMGDINVILWPIQNILLRVCGFDVLPPHIVYGVGPKLMDEKRVKQEVKNWQTRLRTVGLEPALNFVPFEHFDQSMQFIGDGPKFLLPDGTEVSGFGPTVGQNLGKAFPAEGQLKSGLQIIMEKVADNVANPEGGVTPEGVGQPSKPEEGKAQPAQPAQPPQQNGEQPKTESK